MPAGPHDAPAPAVPGSRWTVERLTGTVAELHDRPIPELAGPTAWICRPTDAAIALGSAQPATAFDEAAVARAGWSLVRRRSGGGAVLLVPGEVLWVDLLVPRGDPLWDDDIVTAAGWVGDTWAAVLGALSPRGGAPTVHRGGMVRRPWSDLVCFAGLGPGEVTLGPGGPKVVGVSQRRTRQGARFQCAVLLRWDPAGLLAVAALDPEARAGARAALAGVATGLADTGVDASALVDALLAALLHRLP